MRRTKVPVSEWTDQVREGLMNVVNYRLSGGPLEQVVDGAKRAIRFLDRRIPLEEALRYRQQLGGFFTSSDQLLDIPGVKRETLERLASLIGELDLAKLNALVPQTTQSNRVDAYVNGPDCLAMMLEELNKAERYIHLSVMLFFHDEAGTRIAQALLDALERGVIVRVMVDYGVTRVGYGKQLSVGDFQSLSERLEAAGAKLINTFDSCYGNTDWPDKRAELASQGVPESSLFLQDFVQEQITTGLNVVNHRKFIVIDGVTGIVGSVNVGDQYLFGTPIVTTGDEQVDGRPLGIPSKEEEWHDGCFRIRGAAAQSLNHIFAFQWTVLGGDVYDPCDSFYYPEMDRAFGEEECTLFASFPGNPVNLISSYYLGLLNNAGDEAIIVNPYLIDQAFWDELGGLDEEQAGRISICNPLRVNDHPTNLAAVRSNMYRPFVRGVSFYDYSATGRFSHWKITYDKQADCVFHGSYNINERSAYHDFELGLLVKGKAFAEKVRRMIGYDLSVSRKVTDKKEFFKHPAFHPSTYLNKLTKDFT